LSNTIEGRQGLIEAEVPNIWRQKRKNCWWSWRISL